MKSEADLESKIQRLAITMEAWKISKGRIVIAGGPLSGKGQIAGRLEAIGLPVHHTDILRDTHAWGDDSAEVARWMLEDGPWIIEGVTAVRAARKFMTKNPDRKPCDLFVWTNSAIEPRNAGQEAMAKGCATIYAGTKGELERRGVQILEVP